MPSDESAYNTMSVAELKELLKERNLQVSGKKAELIARLESSDTSSKKEDDSTTMSEEKKASEEVENSSTDVEANESESEDNALQEINVTVSSDDVVDAIIEYIKKNDAAVSEVFDIMDLNSDGRISGPELQSWLKSVGIAELAPPEVMMTLGLIDENKDGYISLKELRLLVGEKASALGLLLEKVEEVVDELVSDVKRIWDAEQSLLAQAFPQFPFLSDKRVNRGIIAGSLFGILLYLYNAFLGIARGPDNIRDHSIDPTSIIFRISEYSSAPAPHFDPLSFLIFVAFGALLFFAQYVPEEENSLQQISSLSNDDSEE